MTVKPHQNEVDPARGLLRALLAIAAVIGTGTVGYMFIEGWDFWQALFFAVITITTVGYGDYGLSELGERFTVILLLCGLGVATYSFSQMVQLAIRYRATREARMLKDISRLSDHFIICGLGRIGQAICTRLMAEGRPFAAIDPSAEAVKQITDMGGLAMVGDASQDEILLFAGVENAKYLACVTSSDSENIVIALSARLMSPNIQIISRIEHSANIAKCEKAGTNMIVSPMMSGAQMIVQRLLNPGLASILGGEGGDTGFSMVEVCVEPGARLDGRAVRDYGQTHPDLVFVAMRSEGSDVQRRPRCEDVLHGGDRLILAGPLEDVEMIERDARLRAAA